jgi:putative oxidoreductase
MRIKGQAVKQLPQFERALGVGLRLLLAYVFLAAGIPKFLDPATFVEHTANYDLLSSFAPIIAVTLPPIEIAVGVVLLLAPRTWRQAATLITFALMCVFTYAVYQAWRRGIDVECGCFGKGSERIGLRKLAENISLTLSTVLLFVVEFRRRLHGQVRQVPLDD